MLENYSYNWNISVILFAQYNFFFGNFWMQLSLVTNENNGLIANIWLEMLFYV